MADTLYLLTAEPTLFPSVHEDYLTKIKSGDLNEIKIDEQEKIVTSGEFINLHLYTIVTHTKFGITPDSINLNGKTGEFSAEIKFLDENVSLNLTFKIPEFVDYDKKQPITITARSFNQNEIFDGFCFEQNNKSVILSCDLFYIVNFATNLTEKIPLKVEYIGIADKFNEDSQKRRNATSRLGEDGHAHLQTVLAKLQRTPSRICTICLYKFNENDFNKIMSFPDTIKSIEATMISYFQPKYNIQRLKFPNKNNLKNKTSLESIIQQVGIRNLITFLAVPKHCSMFSEKISNGNINDEIKLNICSNFKVSDNFEHAIWVKMEGFSCLSFPFDQFR